MRVLIKASSPMAQAGLQSLLEEHPGFELVSASSLSAPGLKSGDESLPDVYLVEAESLADNLAREAVDWAVAGGPVVLLVRNPGTEAVAEALGAGVKALLPSGLGAPELVAALQAAALGLVVLQDIEHLLPTSVTRLEKPVEPLTPREIEVLRLLAAGLGNKEVAARLEISEHTAKFHVASIMGKLGASSRTEAVTLGIRQGLIMV